MGTARVTGTTEVTRTARATRAARALGAAAALSLGLSGCAVLGDVLAGEAPQPVRDGSGAIVEEGDVDAMSLRVGDCLTLDWDGPEEETVEVWTVHVTPCASPHDSEAYALSHMTGSEFPGEKRAMAEADEFCYGEFSRFVGTPWEDSRLDFTYLYPTAESWDQLRDRELLCIVNDPAGGVVGSLRKSQR